MSKFSLYERYADLLGGVSGIDMGQGMTPLVRSRSIGPRAGIDLWFKLEQLNPTGSYKDRFAGIAIADAVAKGHTRCVATSSGNTGAALAAFSANAGLKCALFVSPGAPEGKLRQMQAYGADVFRVSRFTLDGNESSLIMDALNKRVGELGLELLVTAYARSPGPMEGIKTIAYELAEQLNGITDVYIPAGGAGLYVAVCRGFDDLAARGQQGPRMHIVQPDTNDTVVTPLLAGADKARSVDTVSRISGLGVAFDLDGSVAMRHARASGGTGVAVDEPSIWDVQRRLAVEEGLLVEPAGATSVAGCLAAAARGDFKGGRVVCLLTGHGFKDPDSVAAIAGSRPVRDISRLEIADVLS